MYVLYITGQIILYTYRAQYHNEQGMYRLAIRIKPVSTGKSSL